MTPETLGPYRIVRTLGSGGMADVFLGRHRELGLQRAIKTPLPALLVNEQARERFLHEARTAAGLKHEAIVPVVDFGREGERPYIVMDYMAGGSLADRLETGPLPPAAILTILERIAGALDYAHTRSERVIHRDVKPGNILFDEDERAYLSDFGIARVFAADGEKTEAHRTALGMAVGTFTYASPEQAKGSGALDGRSDLYSLGVVAFEMLTGDVPYKADSGVQLGVMHVTEPVPDILEQRPDLPPATRAVMAKALAKRPDDRYQTGAAFVEDLRLTLAGRPPLHAVPAAALPDSHETKRRTPARRKPARAALLGVGLVLLLGAAALGYPWLRQRLAGVDGATPVVTVAPATEAASTPEAIAIAGAGGATAEPTASPEPQLTATPYGETIHIVAAGENLFRIGLKYGFTAQDLAAYNGLESIDALSVGQEIRIPPRDATAAAATEPAASAVAAEGIVFQSNRDGDYDIYFLNLAAGEQTQLTTAAGDDTLPRVSPDGRRILFVSERDGNEEIYVMNRDGSGQTQLTSDPARDELPAWSPDGAQIVFASSRDGLSDLFVMDADGGNVRQVSDTDLREGHVSWSVSGQLAYNASEQRYWQLYVADADGANSRRVTNSTYDEWSPEWSPDGQWLLFHSERDSRTNPGIYLMRPDGSEARLLYNGEGEEWGASWSPDGTRIVFTTDQPDGTADLFVMNADGSNVARLLERGGYPSWARAVDGGATSSARQPLNGDGLVRLTFGEMDHYTAALAGNQSLLLVSAEVDGRWQILEVDPDRGGVRRQITSGQANHYQPEPLSDGRTFLAASDRDGDQDIYRFDLATGEVLEQMTDNPDQDYAPRALPDGSGFVFTRGEDTAAEIVRSTYDGQEMPLTMNGSFDGLPAVSTDSQWITFQSGRDGDYEIYVMRSNGGDPRRLAVSRGRDASPAFSPDGRWVVFESERTGNYEIHAIPFEGGEAVRLTDSPGGNWAPSVSPDGRWLIFQSDREGYMDIFRQPLGVESGAAPPVALVPTPAGNAAPIEGTAAPAPCAVAVNARWAGLTDADRERLGCPISAARSPTGAFQYYAGGTTVWREDLELVYVLYNSGDMAVYPALGPKSYYVNDLRKGAFGYLWDNNQTVQGRLGAAVAQERRTEGFLLQDFEGGVALYFNDSGGQTYAAFVDAGAWRDLGR